MAEKEELDPRLKTALNLDGSPEAIKRFYADWAETYDKQTAEWNYAAPSHAVAFLQQLDGDERVAMNALDPGIRIMDAGCGTGSLARLLSAAGYRKIDGFDLSEDMVEIARRTGLYGEIEGGVDINEPVREEWRKSYDCTICVGVFTPGHVPPESLTHLIDLTRSGGVIIVSTRVAYYESENYQAAADSFESTGQIRLLSSMRNATYTDDERAHYWVYLVR